MFLKRISLYNFRNVTEAEFYINPSLTVIIGENAKGKTNLLEAVYFLINGFGFRETKEEELINFDKNQAYVDGEIEDDKKNKMVFRIHLQKKQNLIEKIYFINKTIKKHHQYLSEQTKAVLFSPDQIEIITGSPDKRRSYFNSQISSHDYEYRKKLLNYENALRKRNKIFAFIKNESELRNELLFWNEYLEEQATYITAKRAEYVKFLNNHRNIDNRQFYIEYLKNELTGKKLEENFLEEKRLKKTLIGPQKDDFCFYQQEKGFGKNLHHYGSRSEQRLAVFWLKINEINYSEDRYQRKPILLLDDVFSELDAKNRQVIIELVKKYQTIITTAESEITGLGKMDKQYINLE